jgi:acyl transferase domain-containing protein/acyl carrier protein
MAEREPIAIIGIGCRFPGADGPAAYWRLLSQGIDAISEVPADRWSLDAFYDPDPAKSGKVITRWGGFVDQVDAFDAGFFRFSPREAARIDPQQRLLLEVTWEALEDAGLVPDQLAGSQTGVFVGGFALESNVMQLDRSNRHLIDTHTATGSMMTMVANRLSHAFDFRGPSLATDTACSSSLVATHLACQSIWNGEATLALAGGVNVMLRPEFTIAESKGGFLSPDGRCKSFDARANGYVRGEGAGVVILKPLSAALAAGDRIYALIRATGVNQDGHTQGITVPSRSAQEALLREVCRRAGVAPADIQYVEAHGTGTAVGDPIEVGALGGVLSTGRSDDRPLVIGSTKTNIGHLEAAAGVAGLIKAALCLKNGAIAPNLHFQSPNPAIPFDELKVRVPTSLEPWPAADGPRLAGVNSFGFGGTNAHAILQEAPAGTPAEAGEAGERSYMLPLSARGPEALRARAAAFASYLTDEGRGRAASLADICYSAGARRGHHDHRLAVVGGSHDEIAEQLAAFASGEGQSSLTTGRVAPGQSRKLAFVFSGMGPQWWAMGRQLMAREPVFRAAVERCDAALGALSGWSLLDELMADEASSRMAETEVAQPANFAIQIGLAELWRSWGIHPDAVVGHSAGEAAAAYVSGALSWDDAIAVVYHRSRLQQLTSGQGRMLAVGLSLEDARQAIVGYEERVSIAAVNGPTGVALVGDAPALEAIAARLEQDGVFNRFLHGKVPYHSHYMAPIRDELLASLAGISPRTSAIPLYSTVTGAVVDGEELDAEYWWRNVREPVYFAAAVGQMIDRDYDLFLEIGPHPVLGPSIVEGLADRGVEGSAIGSLRRREDEPAALARALGGLYTAGVELSWAMLHRAGGQPVTLPAYPWQRERHWIESEDSERDRLGSQDHPLLGRRVNGATPTWTVELSRHRLPFLSDHRIQGAVVFPGAGYVEMALAAARQSMGDGPHDVEQIAFKRALFLPDAEDPKVQTVVDPETGAVEVSSQTRGGRSAWTRHATLQVRPARHGRRQLSLSDLWQRCGELLTRAECYQAFEQLGFQYGPHFQGIESVWRGDGELLGELEPHEPAGDEYQLHPTVLDACFQLLIAAMPTGSDGDAAGGFMPVGIDRVRVVARPSGRLWAYARVVERSPRALVGDLLLLDDAGNVLAEVEGFRAEPTEAAGAATHRAGTALYALDWRTRADADEAEAAEPAVEPGSWLLFADEGGTGHRLAAMLEEEGHRCLIVLPGDSARPASERELRIDPSDPDAFRALLIRLADGEHPPCRGVVYLWGLGATIDDDQGEVGRPSICQPAMYLVQALAEADWRRPPRLWMVTRGAQAVGPDPASVSVGPAALWGFGRVVAHEHAEIWGGLVDLDPAPGHGELTPLVEQILRPGAEDQVALRGGQRLVARLTRLETPAAPPARLRADGGYMITGGLGGLGLAVAGWMVERGARRLILVGRAEMPARGQWSRVDPASPTGQKIAAIRALEARGASVHLASFDVADERQLAAFLRAYGEEGWPPIRGVVHAAGIVQDQLLLTMEPAALEAVARPKTLGAWALHRQLADAPLDFFVLFSSVASMLGTIGQANYAAANASMDALAHHRRAQGLPALSLNWGPWAEVGMAARLGLGERHAQLGLHALEPALGLQAMGQLLFRDQPQVGVLAMDWPQWIGATAAGRTPALLSELEGGESEGETGAAGSDNFGELLLLAGPDERLALVEARLKELVVAVLGLGPAQFDPDQPLSLLGIDSLLAMQLKTRVEHDLGVKLSVIDLLKGSSASELAAELAERVMPMDDEVARLLGEVEQLSSDAVEQLLA